MENKNNKAVLITIIVLLCIFTPLTIVGLLTRNNVSPIEENPNHETFFKGHLWFYDAKDELLSKYECATEICEYTNPTIDDDTYGIKYYKNGTINSVSLIKDKYTFITDGAVIHLFAADTGNVLQTYKAVKTYNSKLDNNAFIVQNSDGLWGVLTINETLGAVLPFEYSFIGILEKEFNDGVLSTKKFIVQKDSKWYLADDKNSAITGELNDPIVEYTNELIFTKNSERVKIFGYDGYEYLEKYTIKNYILLDDYIGIISNNFVLVYNDITKNYIANAVLTDSTANVELEKTETELNIKINGDVAKTIELK